MKLIIGGTSNSKGDVLFCRPLVVEWDCRWHHLAWMFTMHPDIAHWEVSVAATASAKSRCTPLYAFANAATAAYIPTATTTVVSAATFCWL
jgi:hypothetical protein